MKFLSRIGLRGRLLLVLLPPFLGLVYLSAAGFLDRTHTVRQMARIQETTALGVSLADLTHQLQIERGLSVGFLASGGRDFASRLDTARSQLDEAADTLARQDLRSEELRDIRAAALQPLADLTDLRRQIRAQTLAQDAAFDRYQVCVRATNGAFGSLTPLYDEATALRNHAAHLALLRAKEDAAGTRGLVVGALERGSLSLAEYRELAGLERARREAETAFETYASDADVEAFRAAHATATALEAENFLVRVLGAAPGEPLDLAPETWWRLQSGRVDALFDVERQLSDEIARIATRRQRMAEVERQRFGLLALAATILSLFVVWFVSRELAGSLGRAVQIARRVGDGDLTVEVEAGQGDEIGRLQTALADMVRGLRTMTREAVDGIGVLASSSSELSASATELAATSTETAASVTEAATTAEEVRQTVETAAEKAREVARMARETGAVADEGESAVAESVRGIQEVNGHVDSVARSVVELGERTRAIGDIIATVNDLAEQSNLLAVNAAIEAAKAGEEGRGFGVVAREIRSLAEQSKTATAKVRTLLEEIQDATGRAVMATEQGTKAAKIGVERSEAAGASIRELATRISAATQAAAQIAATGQQQLLGVEQVHSAMENIRSASEQVTGSTRQIEESARALEELGRRLHKVVERYRL